MSKEQTLEDVLKNLIQQGLATSELKQIVAKEIRLAVRQVVREYIRRRLKLQHIIRDEIIARLG